MQNHIIESALAKSVQAQRLAEARVARLGRRDERTATQAAGPADVTIRFARAGERRSLARLAELDSHAPLRPDARVLVAEIGGDLVAAVPLSGGSLIADPFRRTTDVAALLEVRAEQLRSPAARRSHLRLAPAVVR